MCVGKTLIIKHVMWISNITDIKLPTLEVVAYYYYTSNVKYCIKLAVLQQQILKCSKMIYTQNYSFKMLSIVFLL